MTGLRITGHMERAKRARAAFATVIAIVLNDVLEGRRDPASAIHTLELRLRADQRRFLGRPPAGHNAWNTFGPPVDMRNIRDAYRRRGASWIDVLNTARKTREEPHVRT